MWYFLFLYSLYWKYNQLTAAGASASASASASVAVSVSAAAAAAAGGKATSAAEAENAIVPTRVYLLSLWHYI
jgi:hypothetical protein